MTDMKMIQWLMRLVILGLAPFASAADTTNSLRNSDLKASLEAARTNQLPVLLEFTASWCVYCRQMEQSTFQDSGVLKQLAQMNMASVDYDKNPEAVAKYAIRGIPAFVMLTPEGQEAHRSTGFQDAKTFAAWLTAGVGAVAEVQARRAAFRDEAARVAQQLESGEEPKRREAVALLFDFCARPETESQAFATFRLEQIAAKNPAWILEGLNHSKLAARIQAANLMRTRLGDAFNVDPWETVETRRNGVKEWQAKLTGKK
jgi:thioredoxin-like negative regulator of GroEL